jgi:hypothetical protein
MKRRKELSLIVIAATLLAFPGHVRSNAMPIGVDLGGAMPIPAHESIRMDSEQVTMRLRRANYTVEAVFYLFNTGEATVEWVGFPVRGPNRRDFVRLDAWVNGRKTEFTEVPNLFKDAGISPGFLSSNTMRWLVSQIAFRGNAETTIRVKYEGEYDSNVPGTAYVHANYIFGTGSFWKDTIGKAAFIVDCTGVGGTGNVSIYSGMSSGPRVIGQNVMRYELRDFEPWPGAEFHLTVHGQYPQSPQVRPKDHPLER